MLESFLTSEVRVIHSPFKSEDEFEAYHTEPFLFSVNGSVMELDLHAVVMSVCSGLSVYEVGQFSDIEAFKTEYHN